MAATLHNQAQIVLAREADCGGDVIAVSGSDGEYARLAEPRVNPSQSLRETGLVADIVGILYIGDQAFAAGAADVLHAGIDGKFDRDQVAVNFVVERFPGCLRRPVGVGGPATTKSGAGESGRAK